MSESKQEMSDRFSEAHVRRWREDGFAIIPGFFSKEEIAPIVQDYDRLYGGRREADSPVLPAQSEGIGAFNERQFANIDTLPYEGSVEMNLISLHPALIDFARAALGVGEVHLYQSHTWAKFTGSADYAQPFHCDFGNHTLTVPADEPALRAIDFILYFTDVTDAHGALHYVTKGDAAEVLGHGAVLADEEHQAALMARERSAAGPAGTLVAHGIDTFHRGTNLTAPGGHRYTMTVGYRAAGNEMISFHVWQVAAGRRWSRLLKHATPEQLACLGVPRPGDPFWTERTLALTSRRWPNWDLSEYAARLTR